MNSQQISALRVLRRAGLYLLFGVGFYSCAHAMYGCGGSALGAHAEAAAVVRDLSDTSARLIESECQRRGVEAARDPEVSREEAVANAEAVIATCERLEEAQHAVAAAHTVWVSFLLRSVAEDEFSMQASLRLAIDVVRFYGELVPLSAAFGLELPEVPPVVLQLVGRDEE